MRLHNKVKNLSQNFGNYKVTAPTTPNLAYQMLRKLADLDKEYQAQHYLLIESLDEGDESLAKEQETLDDHDEDVAMLVAIIEQLIEKCSQTSSTAPSKTATRKLALMQESITTTQEAIDNLPENPSLPVLQQYQEKLDDFKIEMSALRDILLSISLPEDCELESKLTGLYKQLFNNGIVIKRLLCSASTRSIASSDSTESRGVKLPKLEVPTFDGNILNWRTFWEQFSVSVHQRTDI